MSIPSTRNERPASRPLFNKEPKLDSANVTCAVSPQTTKGKWLIRHIQRDANKLGVTRSHLWQVLTGKRISASLLQRYARLVAVRTTEKENK